MNVRFLTRDSRDIFILACILFRIIPIISISNLFRQLEDVIRNDQLFSEQGFAVPVT